MSPSLLGEACAWVVLQMFNKREPIWMNNRLDVHEYGRKVLNLVRGFKSVHPNIKNADRFTDSEVIQRVTSFIEGQ